MLTVIIAVSISIVVWIGFAFFGISKKKWSPAITISVGCLIAVFTFIFIILINASQTINETSSIEPTYNQDLKLDERNAAEKAFAIFCERCQPLMGKYISDIEKIEISNGFSKDSKLGCMDYRCRDYGWDKEVYIKIKLKEELSVIPNSFRALGHTLHFYLGGPKNPGITTSKFPELCGVQKSIGGSDAYIPEQKLAFIK